MTRTCEKLWIASNVAETLESELWWMSGSQYEAFITGLVSCELASEAHGLILDWAYPVSFKRSKDDGIILAGHYYVPAHPMYSLDCDPNPLILDWSGITVLP